MLVLLLACRTPTSPLETGTLTEIPTDGDSGEPDSSEIVPPESGLSDCTDGVDNDGDGLADCEDDGCLEVCLEDCADGVDNDGDGLADCEDDECLGEDACLVRHTITLTSNLDRIRHYTGDNLQQFGGISYEPAVWIRGTIALTGESEEGGAWSCSGALDAGPEALSYKGSPIGGGGVTTLSDTAISLEPTQARGALSWSADCPVDRLPAITLLLHTDSLLITDDAGTLRYTADRITRSYLPGYESDYLITDFESLSMDSPRTWTADLPRQ